MFIIWETMLCISGVPISDLKSMINCPGDFIICQISPQGMSIWNELERLIYANNTNCFKCSICSVLFTAVRLCVVITMKEHGYFKIYHTSIKFVKKSGSEIHDHKNLLHSLCHLLIFRKSWSCIYPILDVSCLT